MTTSNEDQREVNNLNTTNIGSQGDGVNVMITSNIEDDYLLIKASCIVNDLTDYNFLMSKFHEEIIKYEKRKVLVDMREVKYPVSPILASDSVSYISNTFPNEIRVLKIAGVVSSSFKVIADFWEFQAIENGMDYKVFTSIEEAHNYMQN